jgi:hypothetical protein
MSTEEWGKVEARLKEWMVRTRHSQHSHHEAGKFYKTLHYIYGVPVVVLTTVIGTSVFASLDKQVADNMKIWLGALSMSAAALTAVQTHFQFSERSEKHKGLGARYGNIRREIEEVLTLPSVYQTDPKKIMDEIREKLDAIGSEGPVVPRWIWNRTLKMLNQKDKKPPEEAQKNTFPENPS